MFSTPPALHLDFRLRETSNNLTLTDDLQIHLLQLNFLQVDAETVYNATQIERWAWFLSNAEYLTTDDVRRLFPDKEFTEAAGVLEMIAKTPEQLIAYNARLKSQRDEAGRILSARQEGEQIGKALGRQIGKISILRELLGLPAWTAAEFSAHDDTQLSAIADELQQQMRDRMS